MLYAFYWGILGVVWLRIILPLFLQWLSYVPKKWQNKLTLILLLFMLFNTLLSVGDLQRWNQREKENEPNSLLDSFFDLYFNDSTMKKIYPNMDFK